VTVDKLATHKCSTAMSCRRSSVDLRLENGFRRFVRGRLEVSRISLSGAVRKLERTQKALPRSAAEVEAYEDTYRDVLDPLEDPSESPSELPRARGRSLQIGPSRQ
jgi:hypothetical protein